MLSCDVVLVFVLHLSGMQGGLACASLRGVGQRRASLAEAVRLKDGNRLGHGKIDDHVQEGGWSPGFEPGAGMTSIFILEIYKVIRRKRSHRQPALPGIQDIEYQDCLNHSGVLSHFSSPLANLHNGLLLPGFIQCGGTEPRSRSDSNQGIRSRH